MDRINKLGRYKWEKREIERKRNNGKNGYELNYDVYGFCDDDDNSNIYKYKLSIIDSIKS